MSLKVKVQKIKLTFKGVLADPMLIWIHPIFAACQPELLHHSYSGISIGPGSIVGFHADGTGSILRWIVDVDGKLIVRCPASRFSLIYLWIRQTLINICVPLRWSTLILHSL